MSCTQSPYKVNRMSMIEPQIANKENQYLKSIQGNPNEYYAHYAPQGYVEEQVMNGVG